MRDQHYNVKNIRMSEEVWDALKTAKLKSEKSWNLFLRELLENDSKRSKN